MAQHQTAKPLGSSGFLLGRGSSVIIATTHSTSRTNPTRLDATATLLRETTSSRQMTFFLTALSHLHRLHHLSHVHTLSRRQFDQSSLILSHCIITSQWIVGVLVASRPRLRYWSSGPSSRVPPFHRLAFISHFTTTRASRFFNCPIPTQLLHRFSCLSRIYASEASSNIDTSITTLQSRSSTVSQTKAQPKR